MNLKSKRRLTRIKDEFDNPSSSGKTNGWQSEHGGQQNLGTMTWGQPRPPSVLKGFARDGDGFLDVDGGGRRNLCQV
jgi:hypothetical protein